MASYIYRPLAASKGATLRCAGIVSEYALATHPEAFVLADEQHLPGAFISAEYAGPSPAPTDPRLARLFTEAELASIDRSYALRKASGAMFLDEVRRACNEELRHQR